MAVSSHLNDGNPMSAWPKDETNLTVERHLPKTLDLDSQMDDDYRSLFAVANGLAIHREHWPVIFQSNQIEPLTPTEEIENTSNSYWCLDAK